MNYQITNCPTTLSDPGVLRRCILPFGHSGDHCDEYGPWGLRLAVTPSRWRCAVCHEPPLWVVLGGALAGAAVVTVAIVGLVYALGGR